MFNCTHKRQDYCITGSDYMPPCMGHTIVVQWKYSGGSTRRAGKVVFGNVDGRNYFEIAYGHVL